MKRILTAILTLCLLTALAAPAFGAETGNSAVQTVKALGILTGDENGNTDLSGKVSRAEFAFMLAAASSYKDSVSREGSGYSLFKDVKNGHWASEAIQLSIQQGWMTGYTNGTFRPEQSVTLEEACAALLKLLGYDASSLAGSFPQAQLSKASALGLRDQVSAVRGQALNRQNCVNLFYNLLTAKTSDGQTYGVTLGYAETNGEIDYTAVALENVSGPYVAASSLEQLPFEPSTIYKNDKTPDSGYPTVSSAASYSTASNPAAGSFTTSYSTNSTAANAYTEVTSDLYYSGGYLGTLAIPSLGVNVKIYEGTDSAQLAKGTGHFTNTSIWDGNAAFAAHNRGVNEHFGKIHTLNTGDTITLTTKLGTRSYAVTDVIKVSETDNSMLAATSGNCSVFSACSLRPPWRWGIPSG